MFRFAGHLLLASSLVLLPLAVRAAPSLSMFLKGYYTDYEIVLECSGQEHLTTADAAEAKNAIGKIEAYYLHRDPSINKEHLLKQAASNKAVAFKMIRAQTRVETGRFCKGSFNDLVSKLRDIDQASADKGGS
jgi:hypothetical protein